MSFNVTPKGGAAAEGQQANAPSPAQDARARAISKFMGSSVEPKSHQSSPVLNPNSISPEELGALKTSSDSEKDKKDEELAKKLSGDSESSDRQKDTLESDSDTTSGTQPETPEEPKKAAEEPLSSQYAVLARKEKALRAKAHQQEQAISQRESTLKAREDALKAKESEYQSGYISKDALTNDPWSVLADLGITYDQVTQAALNQQQENPYAKAQLSKLQEEIKSLKDAQERAAKSQQDQQSQAYQQALEQIRSEAKYLVNQDPAFETIAATNSVNDVVDLIERTFKEEKVLMTVEEACKAVEDYLVDEALKIAKLKKIQSRLSPSVAPSAAPAKQSQEPVPPSKQSQQPMKTLTNAVGTSRQLNARDRAILAFRGELKK